MQQLKHLFEQLGFSEQAYRIYTHLLEGGPASARTLATNLSIPRPSVYDYLNTLIQKGLVLERIDGAKKLFQADDVRNLSHLLTQRIDTLKEEKSNLDELLPRLLAETHSVEPKIRFYQGVEGVRQVLNDMTLWYKDIDTWALWPIADMLAILGDDYHAQVNRKRIRNRLYTHGLWPAAQKVSLKDHPFLGVGKEFCREIRTAPKGMNWNMGYWIYADKVAFVSSRKETFGFVIHSKDFAEMQKAQFKELWKLSTPIKPETEFTKKFLETV
jgi:DNA-binding MarR family transcriptional regulator